jgi:hypothetical protein
MAPPKPQPLEERIASMRAELDDAIDRRAAEIAKQCPGVPLGVIRNSLTRGMGCQCAAYLQLQAKEEAA